uniref:fibrinogen-related protein n=1 Tax=Salmonella sp. s55004 TaxID=3159675 RepID=UPI00397EEF2A
FVDYADFSIASEDNHYQLQVGGFSSDTEPNNLLENHSGSYFSTPDLENDRLDTQCAAEAGGGWWYLNQPGCWFVDLNGDYDSSFAWFLDNLSQSTMKIRPDL